MLPQFEAAGAQVVGVSADAGPTLDAFVKQENIKHLLLSDFRRQMLPAYGAMETNEQSPIFRYAKRAYFIIDKQGVVKYIKIQDNPLNLLEPAEVLQALKTSGAA
jgi:peroxiredoxin Q/BCP